MSRPHQRAAAALGGDLGAEQQSHLDTSHIMSCHVLSWYVICQKSDHVNIRKASPARGTPQSGSRNLRQSWSALFCWGHRTLKKVRSFRQSVLSIQLAFAIQPVPDRYRPEFAIYFHLRLWNTTERLRFVLIKILFLKNIFLVY